MKGTQNTVWVKKSPLRFSDIFPNDLKFLVQILHAYFTFLSTLDYKFLLNSNSDEVMPYCVTNQRAFRLMVDILSMMVVTLNMA